MFNKIRLWLLRYILTEDEKVVLIHAVDMRMRQIEKMRVMDTSHNYVYHSKDLDLLRNIRPVLSTGIYR